MQGQKFAEAVFKIKKILLYFDYLSLLLYIYFKHRGNLTAQTGGKTFYRKTLNRMTQLRRFENISYTFYRKLSI